MKCERYIQTRSKTSVPCPNDATWEITTRVGAKLHFCGVHARRWRRTEPKRYKPIGGKK